MAGSRRTFASDAAWVTAGNVIYVICESAVGFLCPMFLGVADYGFFRIFSLYAAYTAFLRFGMTDALVLFAAGSDYEKLPRPSVRAYTKLFVLLQAAGGASVALACRAFLPTQYLFIGYMVAFRGFAINVSEYYRCVAESTRRFIEYSISGAVTSVLRLAVASGLLLHCRMTGESVSYKLYLVLSALLWSCMLIYYIFQYRDITFGKTDKLADIGRCMPISLRAGLLLMACTELSRTATLTDRQIAAIVASPEEYSVYAFAHSILSVGVTVIMSASTVLFPYLRRSASVARERFDFVSSAFSTLCSICMIGYFSAFVVIRVILPEYEPSLLYLRFLLPSAVFNCTASVVQNTYLKASNRLGVWMATSLCSIFVGFLTESICWTRLKSLSALAVMACVTALIRYILSSLFFMRRHFRGCAVGFVKSFLSSVLFLAATELPLGKGAAVYLFGVGILSAPVLAGFLSRGVKRRKKDFFDA